MSKTNTVGLQSSPQVQAPSVSDQPCSFEEFPGVFNAILAQFIPEFRHGIYLRGIEVQQEACGRNSEVISFAFQRSRWLEPKPGMTAKLRISRKGVKNGEEASVADSFIKLKPVKRTEQHFIMVCCITPASWGTTQLTAEPELEHRRSERYRARRTNRREISRNPTARSRWC